MFTLILFIILAAFGFMMGVLYKKAITSAQALNPQPQKLLRIFLWVFGIGVIVTFALSYFAPKVLTSTPIPEENNIHYNNLKSLMIFAINVFFFAQVIVANLYSQALKRLAPFPYVLAFCFYAVFILKDAYYITDYYILWQKSMQLIHGDVPDFTGLAWTKCLLALGVTAFNAVMIWWGVRK
jgi:hypothetical protein